MSKKYLKLNNNDEHLSFGNFCRLIKEQSQNKSSALQSEIFCTLFEIEMINDTTVNNYCVGCRSIGSEYKQIFLNKEKRYQKNHLEFAPTIINILNIIEGTITSLKDKEISYINNNQSAITLAKKLYNLAKNDSDVPKKTIDELKNAIQCDNYYEALVIELLFIVLAKKQPIYEEDLKKEVIDNVLNDTSISSKSLEEYLSLKLKEGINYDYSLKILGDKNNAYANFELGSNEYYGYYKGYPRLEEALKYLKRAASLNHAPANYMIANMYIKGLIGNKTKDELKKGYEYLLNSYNLGNIAAANLLGCMYLEGTYPLKKDLNEAIKYFHIASTSNYAYANNNLGLICERENKHQEAFDYYLKAANLGESWACNKVGEYYRRGIITKDMNLAYEYYNKSLESNHRTICYYAYYNLAKYYYLYGYSDIVPKKDELKALEYFRIASKHNCFEATLELFYYYVEKYLTERDQIFYEELMKYKKTIEVSPSYNEKVKEKIEENLKKITAMSKEINLPF